jgi:hypothetical protein
MLKPGLEPGDNGLPDLRPFGQFHLRHTPRFT